MIMCTSKNAQDRKDVICSEKETELNNLENM